MSTGRGLIMQQRDTQRRRRSVTSALLTVLITVAPSTLLAQAEARVVPPADTAGMTSWWRYETIAHGMLSAALPIGTDFTDNQQRNSAPGLRNAATAMNAVDAQQIALVEGSLNAMPRHRRAAVMREQFQKLDPPQGRNDYLAALNAFQQVSLSDPGSALARRQLYMAYGEANSWVALDAEARGAITRDANDTDAWLARGVVAVREGRFAAADTMFAQARRRMGEPAFRAFAPLTLLLQPKAYLEIQRFPDSVRFSAASPAEQARIEAEFWNYSDPRAATAFNEVQLEFYARVAYADFRFAIDAPRSRGSNSDRGRIYIRFGPPDDVFRTDVLAWVYNTDMIIYFVPPFRLSQVEHIMLRDSLLVMEPRSWSTMPVVRRTLPLRARAARFRATADSLDVVVAAAVPVVLLVGDTELGGKLPIDLHLDVSDPNARLVGDETRRTYVNRDSLPAAINATWLRRLGRGSNIVRVDADQPDVERTARTILDATVDSTSGFGMSDLLLGTGARPATDVAPARWHNVSVAPTVGVLTWASPLSIVWENYDFAADSAKARFRTEIALQRTFKNNLRGLIARIGANLKDFVEQDGSGTGRVGVSYDQTRSANAILTDYISLNLDGQVPGPYRLTVTVTDLVTGKTTSRRTDFVLTRD